MPTPMQAAAIANLLKMANPRKPMRISVSAAMRQAGYSKYTANRPQELTESLGFKEQMAAYGLTQELVSCALVDDIEAKPKKRVAELSLAANILRMTSNDEHTQPRIIINAIFE